MPQPFTIAPSEALLIGLCCEEYRRLREHFPDWSFLETVRTRLEPFIPDLKQFTSQPITASEVPTDINWTQDDEDEFGTSPAYPNCLFVKNERGMFRRTLDASRHNLEWLLLFYLDPAIGMSSAYRLWLQGWREFATDRTQVLVDYEKAVATAGPQYRDAFGSDDNAPEIERLLNELMQFNELTDVFRLGRDFGCLCATLRLYEIGCSRVTFVVPFLKATGQLFQANAVQRGTACFSAIKSLIGLFEDELAISSAWQTVERCVQEGWMPKSQEELETVLQEIESASAPPLMTRTDVEKQNRFHLAWMEYWVAFGEVLGSLRDADESVLRVEYSLPVPREFKIHSSDSIEIVREIICHSEAELNKPADSPNMPRRIVANLGPCLETLARRIWPQEFNRKAKDRYGNFRSPGLVSVLVSIRKQSNELTDEHRFAASSLNIYDLYRCAASHDLDSFQCSFEEARYVLAAIRMLLTLSDKLMKKHNPQTT